jgi:hypothetical protein
MQVSRFKLTVIVMGWKSSFPFWRAPKPGAQVTYTFEHHLQVVKF